MKIEIHYLQNFPVGNLNRDDTGSPKDAIFGGFKRARISSQCLKRAIRTDERFTKRLNGNLAYRTRQSANAGLALLLNEYFSPEMASALAEGFISQLVSAVDKDGKTNVLFYVGQKELEEMAAHIKNAGDLSAQAQSYLAAKEAHKQNEKETKKENEKGKKAKDPFLETQKALMKGFEAEVKTFVKNNKGTTHAVEVALFGRMLAEQPDLNVDACCQVAHALSTHKTSLEFDYFTAVDDLKQEDKGAGHLGQLGFNAPCFYRYAVIDADALAQRLRGDKALAKEGIMAFLEASFWAIPSGKQNSSANHTQPSLVFVVVRDASAPQNLVNAFEKPVKATESKSLVELSIEKLAKEWNDIQDFCGDEAVKGFVAIKGNPTDDKGNPFGMFTKVTRVPNVSSLFKGIETELVQYWNLNQDTHA